MIMIMMQKHEIKPPPPTSKLVFGIPVVKVSGVLVVVVEAIDVLVPVLSVVVFVSLVEVVPVLLQFCMTVIPFMVAAAPAV